MISYVHIYNIMRKSRYPCSKMPYALHFEAQYYQMVWIVSNDYGLCRRSYVFTFYSSGYVIFKTLHRGAYVLDTIYL